MRHLLSTFQRERMRFFDCKILLQKQGALFLSTGNCITVGLVLIFLFFAFASPAIAEGQVDEAVITSPSTSVLVDPVTPETPAESVLGVSSSPEKQNTPLFNSQGVATAPDVTASILKVSGGLLLVIAAIFGSAWFFRRFGHFSPVANESLKVIGGLTIGQKEKIVLLQVGDEQVLVGVAPGNIQKLHVLEKPITLNENTISGKNTFSESLGEAINKLRK